MDYDKLIEDFKQLEFVAYNYNINGEVLGMDCTEFESVMADAATAIETLRAENIEMQTQLNEFSEFLCRMTGNLLSKTNYTAQAMISAAEDYQQRVCDNDCDLRAELARVTAERDGAIEDLEEIMFKGRRNIDTCEYCKNAKCYARGGIQVCNPVWRGIKEG